MKMQQRCRRQLRSLVYAVMTTIPHTLADEFDVVLDAAEIAHLEVCVRPVTKVSTAEQLRCAPKIFTCVQSERVAAKRTRRSGAIEVGLTGGLGLV